MSTKVLTETHFYDRRFYLTRFPNNDNFENQMIRKKDVLKMVRIANSTLYRWIAAEEFPKAVKLSAGCVRWHLNEINEWIEAKKGNGVNVGVK